MKLELRDLVLAERASVQQRFESLAAKRFAPSTRQPRREIHWPRAPLDARVLPSGIHPPDSDDEFNDATRLRGFLTSVSSGEFFVGDLSAPAPHFRHAGRLDEDLGQWIETRLVSNPTCLMSSTADVIAIADDRLRYTVIGAPPDIIAQLEHRFGGAAALRDNFIDYVDRKKIGAGEDDRKWAHEHLVRWSGWS